MKYSVIIPVGKKEVDIRPVLNAVYDQDIPKNEYEVIVVLDGVNEPVARQLNKYKKIKLYTIDPSGAAKARNYGYSKSCGDILLFWDADCIMYPGVLSKYDRLLQDNPGAAFAYSAYRYQDSRGLSVYHSRPFDPYLLTCMNYVSTMSPIRRDRFPGFREELPYFQDWDLFLRIVQSGGIGIFNPDVTFDTVMQKEGSISGGQKIPFVDRVNHIKALNNVPRRTMCVTSLGAPLQAIYRAKVLNADYIGAHLETPLCQLPSNFNLGWETIYCMGFYPDALEAHVRLFHGHNGKKLVHWIGTDVRQLYNKPYTFIKELKQQMAENIDINMSNAPWLQDELKEVGYDTDLVYCPIDIDKYAINIPFPNEFTVGVYVSDTNKVHNEEFIQDLAVSLPDCKFVFFGKNCREESDNVKYVPHQDTLKVIEQCSMNLRLTVHDGFPQTPVQFMLAGRPALTSAPIPYATHLHETITPKTWLHIKPQLVDMIRKIKRCPNIDTELVRAAYMSTHSVTNYCNKIYSYLNTKEAVAV